ncbi:MAG: hypothetical protein AB7G75_20085, partial [Candidatus Binatia bacterium]
MPIDEGQKPKKSPSLNPSEKLLSEMTDEEVDALSPEEMADKITQQAIHNLRTHIPDGMEPANPPEKPDPSQEDGQAVYEESCTRCQQKIALAEPHAHLECSLRSFAEEEDTIEVAHAVGFGPLCRTCGEQLQLTSQTVREATKLLRSAQAVPALAQALPSLPPLPPLVLASPYEAGVGDV